MVQRSNAEGELIPHSHPVTRDELSASSMGAIGPGISASFKDSQATGLNLQSALGALRRRWFIAVFLGLAFGISGAVAAWTFIPAPYTSYAELRISSVVGRNIFKTAEDRADFDVWKQTQIKLVKSLDVLTDVLREPDILRLKTIKAQQHPMDWLERNLLVASAGTEFFRVSLSGDNPDELKLLVNTITRSYIDEIVMRDQKRRNEKLAKLQKIQSDLEEGLRVKQGALKKLSDSLRVGNSEQANIQKKFLLEMAMEIRKELGDVRLQLVAANVPLISEPAAAEAPASAVPAAPTPAGGAATTPAPTGGAAATPAPTGGAAANPAPAGGAPNPAAPAAPNAVATDTAAPGAAVASGTPAAAAPATPEPPEIVINSYVEQDPEYQQAVTKVIQHERHVALCEANFKSNNPKLTVARKDLEASIKHRDNLKTTLYPKVKQRLIDQEALRIASQAVPQGQLQRQPNQQPLAAPDAKAQAKEIIAKLEAHKKLLENELATIVIKSDEAGPLTFELENIDKQISQSRQIADAIGNETERLKVELDSPIGIDIFRPAEAPLYREQGKKIAGTALAGLALFFVTAGGILWLDLATRRISVMDEVIEGLSLRILGTIPMLPRFVTARNSRRTSPRTVYWQNVLTESIDATRTMLLRKAQTDGINCVMIASAVEGEGKTTLACHLATSLARAGRRVVLVDCDFRRPSIQKVFGISAKSGLSDVLREEVELTAAIQSAGPSGLSLLPAGRFCPVAMQALARDGLGIVLADLRRQFDFVIVDSSPVLPVTDSLLVAQHVDGVIFAIRRDVSRVARVATACERLRMLGVGFLGAVVIGLDEQAYGGRYPYSNYGYGTAPTPATEEMTVS